MLTQATTVLLFTCVNLNADSGTISADHKYHLSSYCDLYEGPYVHVCVITIPIQTGQLLECKSQHWLFQGRTRYVYLTTKICCSSIL